MVITTHLKEPGKAKHSRFSLTPRVLAIFSFRHDHHLVPDLLTNIAPMVDGWISYDDRSSLDVYSDERKRREMLLTAAGELRASWILAVDPDERFETALSVAMPRLTSPQEPTAWSFNFREMYAADRYRVDGIWGEKKQARLFSFHGETQLDQPALHGQWLPLGRRYSLHHSGFNLYHLRMISPERRRLRRNLYNALDPRRQYQKIGYDYLADETGACFETIQLGREYLPPHVDDAGVWSAPANVVRACNEQQRP